MAEWCKLILLAIACLCFSCGSGGADEEKDEPRIPVISTDVLAKVTSQSIEKDAIVDAETVSTLTLVYSTSVVIKNKNSILLNDRVVLGVAVNDSIVTLPLALEAANNYVVTVKSDAFVTVSGGSVAPFSLSFSTKAVVNINNVTADLCNNDATDEAKALYAKLLSVYGKKTLSGVVASDCTDNGFVELIYSATGLYPAVVAYDFKDIHKKDYNSITAPQEHADAGGVVSFGWCWQVPTHEGANSDNYTHEAGCGFDIRQSLNMETWQYDFVDNDIEIVAAYLKKLQDAGVAVLFNPLREVQNHWWGEKGAPYLRELWKMLYDRLVYRHQLNNLIWVWTIAPYDNGGNLYDTGTLQDWYPGDEFVDIIGLNINSEDNGSQSESFLHINKIFGGRKMIALTECGCLPNPDESFSKGDTWLYFSALPSIGSDGNLQLGENGCSYWENVMNNDKILSRGLW